MATGKRGRKKDPEPLDNSLLEALQFINVAQRAMGTPGQTHCIIREGWAAASDGVLTAGHKVHDDLMACPQTARLIEALTRCKEAFSVTQADADRISVKTGKFRVTVPCVPLDTVAIMWADPNIAPLDERFTEACRKVAHVAVEGAQRVALAAVCMAGPTVMATNGFVVVEAWHGCDLPPFMLIPKLAIAALLKIEKKLIGFGCSDRSVTFHFEDGAWLKSQCYIDGYPNVQRVLERPNVGPMLEVPAGLFEAVNQLAPFANNDHVRFCTDKVEAVTLDRDGAEHDVEGVIEGSSFAVKSLQMIATIATHLDTVTNDRCAYFIGDKLRGAIAKVKD